MNTEIRKKNTEKALVWITRAFITFIIIILTLVLFSGCKKKDDSPNNSVSNTNFNLRMTDAPGNYDAVNIDIIGAEVHSDVSGWVALNVKPGIYNLLDLTNGKDALIGSGQIAVGNVSQIRLILGNNNTIVVDSQVYQLSTPSAQQSGLKLQVHADLIQGITYNMLIDFDAEQSIVSNEKDKYTLKPAIRVISKIINGAIKGIVLPLLANPIVLAINGTDTFSAHANILTGAYFIGGLQAGSYKVVVLPKAPYSDTAVLGVGVTLGIVTDVGLITVK